MTRPRPQALTLAGRCRNSVRFLSLSPCRLASDRHWCASLSELRRVRIGLELLRGLPVLWRELLRLRGKLLRRRGLRLWGKLRRLRLLKCRLRRHSRLALKCRLRGRGLSGRSGPLLLTRHVAGNVVDHTDFIVIRVLRLRINVNQASHPYRLKPHPCMPVPASRDIPFTP